MAVSPETRTKVFRLEQVKNASDSGEKRPKRFKFRANDGDWDRYQDRLSVKGWQLENFNALQGPVLLNHDAGDGGWLGIGRKDVLPIGKARAFVEGDALMCEIEFDSEDELAKKVESKVERGFMGAVSVRYTMKKYHENERGGFDSDEHELLELSLVNIPGNQRALRVKGLDSDAEALVERIATRAAEIVAEKLAPQISLQKSAFQFDESAIRDIAANVHKSLTEKN